MILYAEGRRDAYDDQGDRNTASAPVRHNARQMAHGSARDGRKWTEAAACRRMEAHMACPVVRVRLLYPGLQHCPSLHQLEGRAGRTAARMGRRQRTAGCAMESVARCSVGRSGSGAAGCNSTCGPQDLPADAYRRSDRAEVCGKLRLYSQHRGPPEPGAV